MQWYCRRLRFGHRYVHVVRSTYPYISPPKIDGINICRCEYTSTIHIISTCITHCRKNFDRKRKQFIMVEGEKCRATIPFLGKICAIIYSHVFQINNIHFFPGFSFRSFLLVVRSKIFYI